jgi:hypothetical protein
LVCWAAQRLHVPADSLWATIEAIAAAPAPVGAEQLTETTGMLPVPRMRHRLHVLADWGLLRMRRGAAGRKLYSVPAATRLLLADLAEPARIADPGYRSAAERLGPLLAQNANLLPDSPRTPAPRWPRPPGVPQVGRDRHEIRVLALRRAETRISR